MQGGFPEYDHMVQALAPNGTDHALHVGPLPRETVAFQKEPELEPVTTNRDLPCVLTVPRSPTLVGARGLAISIDVWRRTHDDHLSAGRAQPTERCVSSKASRSETTCLSNAKLPVGKGLCLRSNQRSPAGGFSEQGRQASMTVDMGRFSVSATFRQLIPSARSLTASSRRKTRLAHTATAVR
jgi:hypothetical protein